MGIEGTWTVTQKPDPDFSMTINSQGEVTIMDNPQGVIIFSSETSQVSMATNNTDKNSAFYGTLTAYSGVLTTTKDGDTMEGLTRMLSEDGTVTNGGWLAVKS